LGLIWGYLLHPWIKVFKKMLKESTKESL